MSSHALDVRVEDLHGGQRLERRLESQVRSWGGSERIVLPPPLGRLGQPDRSQNCQGDKQASADQSAPHCSDLLQQRGAHAPVDLLEPIKYLPPMRSMRTNVTIRSTLVARESAIGPLEPGSGGNPLASKMRAIACCCEVSMAITSTVPSGLRKGKDPKAVPVGACVTGIHRSWLGS